MTAFLYLIYIAIGAGTWWCLSNFTDIGTELCIAAGAFVTVMLGQFHILATRKGKEEELEARLFEVEKKSRDTKERIDVVEARTDAVESTVKHELTERRDALVTEMKQLEGLIERLSSSFESKLTETETAANSPRDDAALRDLKEALAEGRVDLHLQPVVSLPQRRVTFYEGFTRLRRADGSLILPAEFLDPARRSGLLGIIDSMSLFRCVNIVRRLADRDRRVGVFCNISAATLEDDLYFSRFLDFMMENRDLSASIIFEMRANDFETRSPRMRENMERLLSLGFRFSLDHSGGLDVDLPRLQESGVRYVKMNGNRLLSELRDPDGPRPICSINRPLEGEDVSAVFARYSVTLIAEKLEDETSVVQTLEYDIPFGQGHVFGAPRPIKSSLMQETAPPAAFIQRLSAVA